MPHCVAVGCSFQSRGNPRSEISLHAFPKDEGLKKQWKRAVGRVQLPKDPRLCSHHFSPDSFETGQRRRLMKELGSLTYKQRLRPGAIPTIFAHKKPKRARESSENRFKRRERQEMLATLLNHPVQASSSVPVFRNKSPSSAIRPTEYTKASVRGQRSKVNAEVGMFDIVVQRQVNAYSPNWDHTYARKGDFTSAEDCDANTEDMLDSLDDSQAPSEQTQCNKPDPEVIPSPSVSSPTKQRLFLVFEDQLKQLLGRCIKCGSVIAQKDVKEHQNEGSQLTLELTCSSGCNYRWRSQPTPTGTTAAGNLQLTAAVFFSGIQFAKFERFCLNMNLKTINEGTYNTLRKKCVFPVIKKTWTDEQQKVLTDLRHREKVTLCGDGRCDSPGHSPQYCTYTFLDTASRKVVDLKVVSAAEVSSSNAMELQGFKESLKTIEDNGVRVHAISTDRQPQITKDMRLNNPEKVHEFDPWHVAKGVCKKLTAETKRRGCEDLGPWIQPVINHLWWSAQTCDGDAVLLKEKWLSVVHHVTNRHEWSGNSLYHRCAHEPLQEETLRKKLWLKPGTEAHCALVKVVTDKRLLKDLEHLTKCVHTTTLEAYHSMCVKHLPKRTHFGYDVMVHAAMLSALEHNHNVTREQTVSEDGESVGEHKYKISWSDVHRSFRARPVFVKDYSYMTAMMEDVLTSVSDTRDLEPTQNSALAPREKRPRVQVLPQTQRRSRFKRH